MISFFRIRIIKAILSPIYPTFSGGGVSLPAGERFPGPQTRRARTDRLRRLGENLSRDRRGNEGARPRGVVPRPHRGGAQGLDARRPRGDARYLFADPGGSPDLILEAFPHQRLR